MSWPVVVGSAAAEETQRVAARLATACRAGDVLLLIGELGAGKTAFAQGFAAALGVAGPVTSPTFALVRQYRCTGVSGVDTLLHADVYRTGSLSEVVDLALAELVEDRAIAVVEWGDQAAPAFSDDVLEVTLTAPPAEGTDAATRRTISLTGRGSWGGRSEEVATLLATDHARGAP